MQQVSQSTLFDEINAQDEPSAPRCRMCTRPARWLPKRNNYAAYCAGAHCNNRERTCQTCGASFHVNADGAGTKYCSTECKRSGYMVAQRRWRGLIHCAWCDKAGDASRTSPRSGWPYICRDCMEPIKHVQARLKRHHVGSDRARALIADPHCECCGTDILVKVKNASTGGMSALLVVDHDHACCPTVASCGQCVRGLICFNCNIAAGMLGDDPDRARAIAKYLERFR